MTYIKGKIRQLIYESKTGYKVGLFRVKETDDEEMEDFLNKTITFTGTFLELNLDDTYLFNGHYVYHDRYGHQFMVNSYEKILPTGKDALIEFLASDLIKGCGLKTATKIVEALGDDALTKIKENPNCLLGIKGITEARATNIYESVLSYSETDETLLKLKSYDFSISEATTLINTFSNKILNIIDTNIYALIEYIPFNKLDNIFIKHINNSDATRIRACIIEALKRISFNEGNTYTLFSDLLKFVNQEFNLHIDEVLFDSYVNQLINEGDIVKTDNKYQLKSIYEDERTIAYNLSLINTLTSKNLDVDSEIESLERMNNIKYNTDQKNAIKTAINNSLTIITGGPGTGKTTIIEAICASYINLNHLSGERILSDIALLAPTGRASKRMSESTHLPATTIHRYLKWNKENNEFGVNEYNKNHHRLIIVDEMSMIDTNLFASLLNGIDSNITLVLVGDANQLPSVGAGNILKDLIDSNYFKYCPLNMIYRQTSNSYIPILAEEIKERSLSDSFLNQKDDYNFIETNPHQIKSTLKKVIELSLNKGYTERDIQILAPLYKGENGIDNLNAMLRDIFNPNLKNSIKIGDVTYKEDDKVLQLVNDPDNNVYNGDIGYIDYIDSKKNEVTINFMGNYVIYKKEDLYNIKHAYAISIHKSQGSEFKVVILPVSSTYHKMLYNKLIYTAVSRAKQSIIIIGEASSFVSSINNDYSNNRLTNLNIFLDAYFK